MNNIDKLYSSPLCWLMDNAFGGNIAISSRIRLARNISGFTFPINSSEIDKNQVYSLVVSAIQKKNIFDEFVEIDISSLDEIEREILLERHLISREFCKGNAGSNLIIGESESFSLMINEEDHIRLQVLESGLSLRKAWSIIDDIDNDFSKNISYAFNKTLGYMTSCPTNIGTGMRASVMLNLPGLALAGYLNAVIHGLAKLGLTVRGFNGEGSDSVGNLYQVSNQSTLGETEFEIIQYLENIIVQIINHEKNARLKLIESKPNFLQDYIGRAYGVLKYSYILSTKEALNSLSAIRMGVDLNMFRTVDIKKINELFIAVQPAHLQKYSSKTLTSQERDILRSEIVRKKLL